jgi:NTP pyrophosphatase (non-canonical NTP hydrolase)
MTYYIYHIPGKKIGVTRDLKERVTEQQGYNEDEYEVLMESDDILEISKNELLLQEVYGYKVDRIPYNELKFNKNKNMKMNINVTEQTTTFPCPVNKLKGQLMDCIGMKWETDHGEVMLTPESIKWIMNNVKESMYNEKRSYVYNKAFTRYFDNNNAHDQYNGRCKSGALSPTGVQERYCYECDCVSQFDLIREWASTRGLYANGDPKTQALKLVEEIGETCRAILKQDKPEIIDGIGDCVVVLTNLAELIDTPIEECIARAYDEIKDRKGKMANGTYVKND